MVKSISNTNQTYPSSGEYCIPAPPQLQELGSVWCLGCDHRKENDDGSVWCFLSGAIPLPITSQSSPSGAMTHLQREPKEQTSKSGPGHLLGLTHSFRLLRGTNNPKNGSQKKPRQGAAEASGQNREKQGVSDGRSPALSSELPGPPGRATLLLSSKRRFWVLHDPSDSDLNSPPKHRSISTLRLLALQSLSSSSSIQNRFFFWIPGTPSSGAGRRTEVRREKGEGGESIHHLQD